MLVTTATTGKAPMCLTGTPAVQTGFGRGAAASPATGLGGSKRRAAREDATAAAARAASLLHGEPSAPETAPGSRTAGPSPAATPTARSLSGCPLPAASCLAVPTPRCLGSPVSLCPSLATAGSAPRQHCGARPQNFCPTPGAAAALSPDAHAPWLTHTHARLAHAHSHTPPGARSPPRHAPPRAGRRSVPPAGGQGVRGRGAARPRAARGAGGAPEEGDAPRGASVLAARPHPQAGRAARTGSRGQPRSPGSPVPSACPACPAAEPRGPLGGSPLRRTWPSEAVAPCLLGAGIGGSPAAPSWRAGGGETAVGWARVPSVFSAAPAQGKKQVIPGSSIISYRRISHFLPLLNFFSAIVL